MNHIGSLNVNHWQWRRYGLAVATVAIALLVKLLLNPLIEHESPFLLFFAAVLVSARYGGMKAGLLATALSAAVSKYFFLTPVYSFAIESRGQGLRLGLFLVEAITISKVVATLKSAVCRAEASRQEALHHQEALHQNEERLRLLVEGVKDYAILMLDLNGRVVSWNPGAERIFGYREVEIIGKHCSQFFTSEDIQYRQPHLALQTAVQTGQTETERWHQHKHGTPFWASSVVVALRDQTGLLHGFALVVRDISDRHQTEEALRQSEERYRQLVELSPDTIFIQCEGKFVFINSAGTKLLGAASPEQLIGRAVLDFVDPDFHEIVQQRIQQLTAGTAVPLIEEKLIRLDGRPVNVEVAASPFIYCGKLAAQVVVRDITERKQIEAALQRSWDELEARVEQRTRELKTANEQLQQQVAERQRAEQALQESQTRLKLINSLSTTGIMLGISVELIIQRTVKQISKHFPNLRVAYATIDNQGQLTVIHAIQPDTMPQTVGLEIDLTVAPEYLSTLRQHKPVISENVAQDVWLASVATSLLPSNTQALINVPFPYSDKASGLLSLESPQPHSWSKHEIVTLIGVTQYLSVIIKNAQAQQERQRAEEALRLLESAVQQINDSIVITTAQLDPPHPQILFVNPAFTKLTGYTAEEVIGKTPRILQGPKTERTVIARLRHNLERQEAFYGEAINYRKDGTEFYMEWHIVPIKNGSGETTHFVAVQRDVTERKRAEKEIQFLQTITQAISETEDFNSALEVALKKVCEATSWNFGEAWIPRSDGTALECSPAWYSSTDSLDKFRRLSQEYYFLPGSGLPGRVWISKQPEWLQDVSLQSETIYHLATLAVQYGLKAALGIPVIANDNVLAVLVFYMFEPQAEEERLIKIISASTQLGLLVQRKRAEEALRKAYTELEDRVRERTAELASTNEELRMEILERQRAEQHLRASEERLRLALIAARMSTWDWNILNDQIAYSNHYELLLGLTPASFDGTYEGFLEYIHPQDRQLVADALVRSVIQKVDYDQEFRIIRSDGSIRWLVGKGQVFYDLTGTTAVRMTGITMDITEHKWATDQIKASLKEKEVLLKEIHHRVKNNLQIISSLLNLQAGYIEDRQALEILKAGENRIASMAIIHEQLYQSKDLARIDLVEYVEVLAANLLNSYNFNSEAVKLETIITNVHLGLDVAIPCGLIINELVSNSLKYAFPHNNEGKIYIDIHTDDEKDLILTVGDNGTGFPPDIDFQNTESLGLQIVTALVYQLQGTIELNRDVGTEFNIKIPQPNS